MFRKCFVLEMVLKLSREHGQNSLREILAFISEIQSQEAWEELPEELEEFGGEGVL